MYNGQYAARTERSIVQHLTTVATRYVGKPSYKVLSSECPSSPLRNRLPTSWSATSLVTVCAPASGRGAKQPWPRPHAPPATPPPACAREHRGKRLPPADRVL